MDYYETSLQILLKENRKLKITIKPSARKVLAFQMFKALYYMQVIIHSIRIILFVIGISNPLTSSSILIPSNSEYVISARLRYWIKYKKMFLIFVQGITEHHSYCSRVHRTAHKLMYGQLAALSYNS